MEKSKEKVNYKSRIAKVRKTLREQKEQVYAQYQQIVGALTVLDGLTNDEQPKVKP